MKSLKSSVFQSIYNYPYNEQTRINLYNATKDSSDFVQRLGLLRKVHPHTGCVNTIQWCETGKYILSGSDDMALCVTNAHNYKIMLNYKTAHKANIFSAKFLPGSDNTRVISCSGDGAIIFSDFAQPRTDDSNIFNCHNGTTYEIVTMPLDPNSFMSCGEDGSVRWFDIRLKTKCTKKRCRDDVIISCQQPVTALAVNVKYPHQVAIGCSDNMTRTFDRRMLSTMACEDLNNRGPLKPLHSISLPTIDRCYRITSVCYSPDGYEVLTSYSSESVYLFNVNGNSGIHLKSGATTAVEEQVRRLMSAAPPVRRLRLRGDWSDTGPEARPEAEGIGQARPQLQTTIMQRMTNVLSRMLNDPMTRAALSAGGEDLLMDDANENERLSNRPHITLASTSSQNQTSGSSSMETDNAVTVESNSDNSNNPEPEAMLTDDEISGNMADNILNESRQYSMINDSMERTRNPSSRSSISFLNSGSYRRGPRSDYFDRFDYTDCMKPEVKQVYKGHRNARTMIKEANFYGDKYIVSGSDCGHIFIWNRENGELVKLLEGDNHVVNCVQAHPTLPILATSGIDYDIKLWAPILEEPQFNKEEAECLMRRNTLMLDETRDTITVPAAFMIRLLACVHSVRRASRQPEPY